MAAKKNASTAAILVFLGSLVYLYLAWNLGLLNGGPWWGANGPAGLWSPILAASAVISAVSLFILSLVGLSGKSDMMAKEGALKATWLGGFALFVVAASTGLWFWVTILGFVLSYIGVGWADM